MGYRSDVGFIVKGDADEMMKVLTLFRMHHPTPQDDPLKPEHMSVLQDGDQIVVVFYAEQWRWYPDYEDVQRVEALWDAFSEAGESDNSTIRGGFIRIGEDLDDTERRDINDGSEYCGLARSISMDYHVDPNCDIRSKL